MAALRRENARLRESEENWRNQYRQLREVNERMEGRVSRMGDDMLAMVCGIGLPSLKLFQGIYETGTVSGGADKAGVSEPTARRMVAEWATGNVHEQAMWKHVQWLHNRGAASRLKMPEVSWLRPKITPPKTGWQEPKLTSLKSGLTATEEASY
jgi:hypothetical protein